MNDLEDGGGGGGPTFSPLLNDAGGDAEHAPAFVFDPVLEGVDTPTGPQRKARDVPFALLFYAVCATTLGLCVYAILNGDASALDARVRRRGLRSGWSYGLARLDDDASVIAAALFLACAIGVVLSRALRTATESAVTLTASFAAASMLALGVYCLGVYLFGGGGRGFLPAAITLMSMSGAVVGASAVLRGRLRYACAVLAEAAASLRHGSTGPAWWALPAATFGTIALFVVVIAIHTALLAGLWSIRGFSESATLFWYVVFSGYWVSGVVLGVYKVCVSGAVAHWYFARGATGQAQQSADPPIGPMLRVAATSSLGSIALGALVVSLLSVASWMLRRMKSVTRAMAAGGRSASLSSSMSGSLGPSSSGLARAGPSRVTVAARAATECLAAAVTVLAKLAEFINRLAYVHIAMHGFSFCVASRRVYQLVGRNPVDLALVELVTRFVLFAAKAFGTCIVMLVTFAYLYATDRGASGITISLVAVASYVILHIFAIQIEYAVTTIFVAHCEDRERSREGGELVRPQLVSVFEKAHPRGPASAVEEGLQMTDADGYSGLDGDAGAAGDNGYGLDDDIDPALDGPGGLSMFASTLGIISSRPRDVDEDDEAGDL